jgi:hypothetical protein
MWRNLHSYGSDETSRGISSLAKPLLARNMKGVEAGAKAAEEKISSLEVKVWGGGAEEGSDLTKRTSREFQGFLNSVRLSFVYQHSSE